MRAVAAMGAGALLLLSSVAALIGLAGSFTRRTDEGAILVAALASLAAGTLFVSHLQRAGGLVALGLGLSIASAALFERPEETHAAVFVVAGGLVAALGGAALVVPPSGAQGPLGRARSFAIAIMCAVGAACLVLRVFDTGGSPAWLALAIGVLGAGVAVAILPDPPITEGRVVVEVMSSPLVGSASSPSGADTERQSRVPTSMGAPTQIGRRPLTPPPYDASAVSSGDSSSVSSSELPSSWLREVARAPSVAIARAPLSAEDALLGARIGPFEIGAELGRGGMSVVYRARDTRSGRDVALKILPPSRAGDRVYRTRFVREVAAMRGTAHANIVAVLDASPEDAPVFYLAMELVEGPSLRAELARRGRLDAREALAIATAIAEALGAAHAAFVVHRDVKPENILLPRGHGGSAPTGAPKLADFGLARVDLRSSMKGATALTRAGDVLGTLAYMAPEQLRGESAGPAADVFALGLVLAEMIVGAPLLGRETAEATMRAAYEFAGLPDAVRALTPPALARVLERALAVDPRARYANGAVLAAALRSPGLVV